MIVTEVLGNLADFDIQNRAIDPISIQWYETQRRLFRAKSAQGVELAFKFLSEGQRLLHEDVVHADEHTVYVIDIVPCEVMVLSPKTLPDMARACYEIGNKHAPLFLEGDELLMPFEAPMFAWLDVAGFAPTRDMRRLSEMLRSNSAQGRHTHDHAHEYSHEYGHSHDGGHSHTHSHGHDFVFQKTK